MRATIKYLILSFLILSPAFAQEEKEVITPAPHIMVHEAYAFATMPGGETGAAFMTIMNHGDADDTLINVESDIAKFTEIHENIIDPDDGKMMMRKIKNISIPASKSAILEPTGKHIMLIKLKEPLTLDSQFLLDLIFEKSGKKTINVSIIQPGASLNEDTEMMDHSNHNDEAEDEDFPEKSFSENNKDF